MKEFYTISKNETTEIIEKKSKFIADIYPVKNGLRILGWLPCLSSSIRVNPARF